MSDDPIYSVGEIADALGVTPATVYNWMNSDQLEYFLYGKAKKKVRRVKRSALIDFARRNDVDVSDLVDRVEEEGRKTLCMAFR